MSSRSGRVCVLLLSCLVASVSSADEPVIDVWYGEHQRFGQHGGHPQRWINVLGRVTPADTILSLTFSLNGAEPKELSFAEDNKRIARDGDFNVEIDRTALRAGNNAVLIVASTGDTTVRKQITIPDPSVFGNFEIEITYDDAYAIYVNGSEVSRHAGLAPNADYDDYATNTVGDNAIDLLEIPTSRFSSGVNTIAVEMHQRARDSRPLCRLGH